MTEKERALLEEEAKAAEENPTAPGGEPTMKNYTEGAVCHADFAQGCEDSEESDVEKELKED